MWDMRDQEILLALQRVARGELSVEAFEDDFVASTWGGVDDPSPLVADVTDILNATAGNDAGAARRALSTLVAPNLGVWVRYYVLRGINYRPARDADEKRAEPGTIVDDLPAGAAEWMLRDRVIEAVEPTVKVKAHHGTDAPLR